MIVPFELDDFQKKAIQSIDTGENVLVTAHTGSGKTMVAKYAIQYWTKRKGRIIYTSPIKTLSNEKYKEFKEDFLDIEIGLLTGDNKINPDGQCLIMTTEILRNALYGTNQKLIGDILTGVKCVIFDEIHYINDIERGHVWEESIMMLNPEIQIIMLSATVNNASDFSKWIENVKKKKTTLITTEKRAVPLIHYIYTNSLREIMKDGIFDTKNCEISFQTNKINTYSPAFRIQTLISYMKYNDLLQTIFFTFSKNNTEFFANAMSIQLTTSEESFEASKLFTKFMLPYVKTYETIRQYNEIKELITKGIAYHHSGVLPILKEIIEILFKKNLIKVLFATETFAVGVNMPTRSVVFIELEKFDGLKKRSLNCSEYKQMSGRAGRRGIDKIGHVIILPCYESLSTLSIQNMLLGKVMSIQSKLKIDYEMILKILMNYNTSPIEFIMSSLYEKENQENIIYFEKEIEIDKKKLETYIFSEDEKKKCQKLYELKNSNKLNKNEKRQINVLTNELIGCFSKFMEKIELEEKIEKNEKKLKYKKNYIEINVYNILNILNKLDYIDSEKPLNKEILTIKGIIASQINECNCILMSEILCQKMLNALSPEEIIGVLSIFVDNTINDDIKISNKNITNVISKIEFLRNELMDIEDSYSICTTIEMTKDYIEVAYQWGCGKSYNFIKENYDIYAGNFIKNMLKIYNIARELQNIVDITKDIELLPKLQKVQELIVRDIVNTDSLYLSKN
jgi:superfamily II RNA helicase